VPEQRSQNHRTERHEEAEYLIDPIHKSLRSPSVDRGDESKPRVLSCWRPDGCALSQTCVVHDVLIDTLDARVRSSRIATAAHRPCIIPRGRTF
jgi:hypothetical protein